MFGGFGGAGARFQQMRKDAASAPERDVSRAEFVKLCIAAGMSGSNAEMHANLNVGLGSRTLVGSEMLKVLSESE